MEQLQLRKGYIRCINCATIFDGFEAVVSGTDQGSDPVVAQFAPAPEPSPPATAVSRQAMPAAIPTAVGLSSVPIVATSAPGPSSALPSTPASTPVVPPVVVRHRQATAQPAPYVPTDVTTSGTGGTEPVFTLPAGHAQPSAAQTDFHVGDVATSGIEPAFRVGDAAVDQELPTVSVVHRRAGHIPVEPIYVEARTTAGAGTSTRRAPQFAGADERSGLDHAAALLWRVAVLIAAMVLVAQLVYIYRAQIASQAPTLRPILERACAELNCTVAYSRRIDLITIAGAALSAQKPAAGEQGGAMQLQLTLRNTYNKPQEWPTLELDLNDFSGTLQVRKNIGPDMYLTEAERQQPFAANTEKVLRLPIALHGLNINGFQVRKFFP